MTNTVQDPRIPFTRFMDMHSGGGNKTGFEYIYIEAPEDKAIAIFEDRFGRHPNNVTCDCCGEDFSVSEERTLEEATAYERGCRYDSGLRKYVDEADESGRSWNKYVTLREYLAKETVLVIYANGVEQ